MTTKTIAALGALSLCLAAQQHITLVPRNGNAIDTRLVSLDRYWEDQQGIHFEFTNHNTKPLTALPVVVFLFDASGKQFGMDYRGFDSLVNRISDTPVQPGEQRTISVGPFGSRRLASKMAEMAAAVFSDGTASGDPAAIRIVQSRWKTTAEMLSGVITILRQSQQSGQSLDSITSQLKAYEQKVLSNASDQFAKGMPHLVFLDALGNLKGVDRTQPPQVHTVIARLITEYTRWLAMFG
jgi:hypothetical protein